MPRFFLMPFPSSIDGVEKYRPSVSWDLTKEHSTSFQFIASTREETNWWALAYAVDRVAGFVVALALPTSVPTSWIHPVRVVSRSWGKSTLGVH